MMKLSKPIFTFWDVVGLAGFIILFANMAVDFLEFVELLAVIKYSTEVLSSFTFAILNIIIFVSYLLIGLILFIQYSNFLYSKIKSQHMLDFLMVNTGVVLLWVSSFIQDVL